MDRIIKKFAASLLGIYTFEDFEKGIDIYPLTFTQLSVLCKLQRKVIFDYKKNTLTMTKEFVGYYRDLLSPPFKNRKKLTYRNFKIIEIPNEIG